MAVFSKNIKQFWSMVCTSPPLTWSRARSDGRLPVRKMHPDLNAPSVKLWPEVLHQSLLEIMPTLVMTTPQFEPSITKAIWFGRIGLAHQSRLHLWFAGIYFLLTITQGTCGVLHRLSEF